LVVIHWITREIEKKERNVIQWTLTEQLEDLDFADDVCLISATHNQMKRKTEKQGMHCNVALKAALSKHQAQDNFHQCQVRSSTWL